jgi:hypothetical protein
MQRIYREVEPGVEQRDARHLGQAFRGAQCSGEVHYHRKINILVFFSFYSMRDNILCLEAFYRVIFIGFLKSTFDLLNSSEHICDYLTPAPRSDTLAGIVLFRSHTLLLFLALHSTLLKQTANIL